MLNDERLEDLAMTIIANAGASRGASFEAMTNAKRGDFAKAKENLAVANEFSHKAHQSHSQLLKLDAEGEVPGVDLLLSHSQDHLMNAQLSCELITELVVLHEMIHGEVK